MISNKQHQQEHLLHQLPLLNWVKLNVEHTVKTKKESNNKLGCSMPAWKAITPCSQRECSKASQCQCFPVKAYRDSQSWIVVFGWSLFLPSRQPCCFATWQTKCDLLQVDLFKESCVPSWICHLFSCANWLFTKAEQPIRMICFIKWLHWFIMSSLSEQFETTNFQQCKTYHHDLDYW